MSARTLYSSDRKFVVWSYQSGGHNGLLLRSRKDNVNSTRISVLFGAVYAVELRFWFDGVTIDEMDQDYAIPLATKLEPDVLRGAKVYRLRGTGWQGYVVGLGVMLAEDEKEMGESVDVFWPPDQPQLG